MLDFLKGRSNSEAEQVQNNLKRAGELLALCHCYKEQAKVKSEVGSVLKAYPSLQPQFIPYAQGRKPVIVLIGTLPVPFQHRTEPISVQIWLVEGFPLVAPICQVIATAALAQPSSAPSCSLKANHKYMARNGLCYLPSLRQWNPKTSRLKATVSEMVRIFSSEFPYVRVAAAPFPPRSASVPPPSAAASSFSAAFQLPPPPTSIPPPTTTMTMAPPLSAPAAGASSFASPSLTMLPPHLRAPPHTSTSLSSFAPPPPSYAVPPPSHHPQQQLYQQHQQHQSFQQPPPSQHRQQTPYHNHPSQPQLSSPYQQPQQHYPQQSYQQQHQQHQQQQYQQYQQQYQQQSVQQERTTDEKTKDLLESMLVERAAFLNAVIYSHHEKALWQKELESTTYLSDDIELWLGQNGSSDSLQQHYSSFTTPNDPTTAKKLELEAEDLALDDAMYYLEKALSQAVIELPGFIKLTRKLARQQFLLRAQILKLSEVDCHKNNMS